MKSLYFFEIARKIAIIYFAEMRIQNCYLLIF